MLGRHEHHDALDVIITLWTETRGKHAAMTTLQRHRVPAGAVYDASDLYADEHLRERDYWDEVEDPDAGNHLYPGRPMRLSKTPLGTRRATPTLGQDNEYVFGELLGMSAEEVTGLNKRGLIGSEPTDAARRGRL